MKKTTTTYRLLALAATLSACLPHVAADDGFYYYRGSQLPLTVDETHVVVSRPGGDAPLPSSLPLLVPVDTVRDSRSAICVYQLAPTATIASVRAAAGRVAPGMAVWPCYTQADGAMLAPTGYIYVKLSTPADSTRLATLAAGHDCEIVGQNRFMPLWYTLRLADGVLSNPVDVANALYATGELASSSPDFAYDGLAISYDPLVYSQWNMYNSLYEGLDLSISEAWNYATGRGVKIAIVDTGIDLMHRDLSDNIAYPLSYDTETGRPPSQVYGPHATHCAGIAAAVRNNNFLGAGVAPDAQLMSISNTLVYSTLTTQHLADGINWAWLNGADIISCSWFSPSQNFIDEAIDNALDLGRSGNGCVFVCAAGNFASSITFPANYSTDILAIANMTQDGSLAWDSNYGTNMFVTAPGTGIISTIPGNLTDVMSGTSMACPHVAGVAALVLERNPNLTAAQVREIIARNTKKVGTLPYNIRKPFGSWNEHYGYGLVDAFSAVLNTPHN